MLRILLVNVFILFLGLLLGFPAHAQKRTCDHVKKPPLIVKINLDIPEATYDYSRTTEELTDDQFEKTVEWIQKQGIRSVGIAEHLGQYVTIRGIASGGYAYAMNYKMRATAVDKYGVYYCPYLTEINIDLFYATKIFIANEIPKGSCEFNEVMKHEWKHHTANVLAIKTYSDRLKKDLPVIAREIELQHGYVDRSIVDPTFEKIKGSVRDMIEIYYDTIWQDSRSRNAKIDTQEEYQRVDRAINLCEKESDTHTNY